MPGSWSHWAPHADPIKSFGHSTIILVYTTSNFMASPKEEGLGLASAGAPRLEIAHVLFMDIVSYSVRPMELQNLIISQLQNIVRELPGFDRAIRTDQLICLPTGDGMALAFFGEFTVPVEWAREIALHLKKNPQFQLRMGIHTGPVYRVADINKNLNIAGGGINFAQRVMDCGDGGHILISNITATMLIQLGTWRGALHDLGELAVKHGERFQVFNLFTDEFGNPDTPAKVRRARTAASPEPNLGRLVAKMCDRRAQEDDFRDTFLDASERFSSSPQIYFIVGEEGQCHESLVERLIHRVEQLRPVDGQKEASGRVKKIPWQYEGEVQQRAARLVYSLLEHLGPHPSHRSLHPRKVSSSDLEELLTASLNAYIVIQHELHAARWDSFAADLLARYVGFWNELPRVTQRPVVLVFMSIILPRAEPISWKRYLPGGVTARRRKTRIWQTLKLLELRSAVPCRVLAELPAILREDVLEWFSLHNIHDSEEKRISAVDRLFQRGALNPKAMGEIEGFCAEEVRRFAAERGFDDRYEWREADAKQALWGGRGSRFQA